MIGRGGMNLFTYYSSLEEVLRAVYPSHPWESSKFLAGNRKKKGIELTKSQLLETLDKAEKAIGIKQVRPFFRARAAVCIEAYSLQPEDWYSVTLAELREVGMPSQVTKLQLTELLEEKYPDYSFEKVYLLRGRFAQQKRLERAVQSLFPVVTLSTYSPFFFVFAYETFFIFIEYRNKSECKKRYCSG